MQIFFYILFFVVGACMGSFLCCQARRLHLRQGKKKRSKLSPRSICLHCKKQLKWYDNLPILSWLTLRGRCRYCHHKIGIAEFISELLGGIALLVVFVSFDYTVSAGGSPTFFGAFPPQDITNSFYSIAPANYLLLFATVVFIFVLFFLAIYDGLYGELPTLFLTIAIIIACIILAIRTYSVISLALFSPELIWRPLLSVAFFGGLYLLLYLISKGKWVGDGDWLLATAVSLALASPYLTLIALFLTNFLASAIMLPTMKSSKTHKIHLGPFMVAAFVIVLAFSGPLMSVF